MTMKYGAESSSLLGDRFKSNCVYNSFIRHFILYYSLPLILLSLPLLSFTVGVKSLRLTLTSNSLDQCFFTSSSSSSSSSTTTDGVSNLFLTISIAHSYYIHLVFSSSLLLSTLPFSFFLFIHILLLFILHCNFSSSLFTTFLSHTLSKIYKHLFHYSSFIVFSSLIIRAFPVKNKFNRHLIC